MLAAAPPPRCSRRYRLSVAREYRSPGRSKGPDSLFHQRLLASAVNASTQWQQVSRRRKIRLFVMKMGVICVCSRVGGTRSSGSGPAWGTDDAEVFGLLLVSLVG